MSDKTPDNIDINALEEAKRIAMQKVQELDDVIAQAKNLAYTTKVETLVEEPVKEQIQEVKENVKQEDSPKPEKKPIATEVKKTDKKKDREQQKIGNSKKAKEREKQQLETYAKAAANRSKGKLKAEPGNLNVRYTKSEVFIFIVDDNELQLKVMQEQFKNSRSFKVTKGFTSGDQLLKYITTRKFPKKSIILVVMDYFLENSDDEDAQNGIAVLAQIKEYDPEIEVIMLSSHADVDIAASAAHFGAITFIQKGNDAMKKIFNNMVWTIREKDAVMKKADTKQFIKSAIIGFILFIVMLITIDHFMKGKLGIAFWAKEVPALDAPATNTPIE